MVFLTAEAMVAFTKTSTGTYFSEQSLVKQIDLITPLDIPAISPVAPLNPSIHPGNGSCNDAKTTDGLMTLIGNLLRYE